MTEGAPESSGMEQQAKPKELSEIFSGVEAEILQQISATIGFRIAPDPKAGPNDVGYSTDLQRKIIYYNPHTIDALAPFRKFAFFAHEFGHHFPDVVAFQDACRRLMPVAEQLLPEEIGKKREILHNIENVLADLLLESAMPENASVVTQELFTACFRQNRGITFLELTNESGDTTRLDDFTNSDRTTFPWKQSELEDMPAYAQFLHFHLVAPFFKNGLPPIEMVAPSIAELYPTMKMTFQEMMNVHTPGDRKSSIFIDTVRTFSALLQERLEQIRNSSGSLSDALGEFEKEMGKLTVLIEGLTAPGKDANAGSPGIIISADSLTEEQRQQLRDLLGNQSSIDKQFLEKEAAALGMTPDMYKMFLDTCERYKPQINSLTKTLTDFVLREYKKTTARNQPNGYMVTPGREVETFHRLRSGETRPSTMIGRKYVLHPKTLQLYKLLDTSSSMDEDLEGTLGFYTVVTKAAFNIQEELRTNAAQYDLKRLVNAPVELEITGFAGNPFLIIPLTPNLNIKDLARGFVHIVETTRRGGWTDDARALEFEYHRMRTKDPRTLKILSMITDGEGRGSGVEPILRQIEEDKSIHFMVNGIGKNGDAIVEYYLQKFRPAYFYHVFAAASQTVEEAVPKNIAFIENSIKHFFQP